MPALDGKVAIVTGGSSGIGAAIATLFIAEGARVVIAGRRRDTGERFARTLGEAASFIRTDVAKEDDVAAMIRHAVAQFGRLDCLVNSAGSGSQRGAIAEIDLAQFDAALGVHVRGVVAGLKHAVPVMAAQGSGSIVTIASVNGMRAGLGGSGYAYAAAKAAAIHFSRCAALELGELGIRVNTVSPGPIVTGIFGKGAGVAHDEADATTEDARTAIAAVLPQWQPLPHVGCAEDIAKAVLFLASDASRLVTGHNLTVDGGVSAGRPIAVMRADIALFREAFHASRSAREGRRAANG